jgi:ApaG protein
VSGPGVVGHQPKIRPGESFEYESFCPLPTPTGNMRGTYQMIDEAGKEIDIRIPLFFLRDAGSLH